MDLRELLIEIEKLNGSGDCAESARMLLLLALQDPTLKQYSEPTGLRDHYREIELRMHAAADQHAAVAEELDSLASSAPCEFLQIMFGHSSGPSKCKAAFSTCI